MPTPFHVTPAKPGELDRLRDLARTASRADKLTACRLICRGVPLADVLAYLERRRQRSA